MVVKAYRADWDGTLQPYALYVPPDYKPGRPGGWPLIVALHGAFSDHRHNLRRVFGLDNRPGENDAEASRNELPLPDVPALVVSPFGRGELMGYDGLGGDDVMRVIADVRRAYDVDPDRITLTGLSMGGGGTWQIGLRHPELFAALAPVCAVADYRRMDPPADERALRPAPRSTALSPLALAANAAHMQVFIFHGDKDPTVPVADSRQMVDRSARSAGWARTSATPSTRASATSAWNPAYKDADAAAHAGGDQARSARRPRSAARAAAAGCRRCPGSSARASRAQQPHLYVYGTHGPPEAVAAAARSRRARRLGADGRRRKFTVKADREVTADDRARFYLVLVGAAPLNALAGDARDARRCAAARRPRLPRPSCPTPRRPGRFTLVLGALTPRGFDRLKRFARPNRDAWAPEPNRPFVLLPPGTDGRREKSVAPSAAEGLYSAARETHGQLEAQTRSHHGQRAQGALRLLQGSRLRAAGGERHRLERGERRARGRARRRRRRSSSSSRTRARSSTRARSLDNSAAAGVDRGRRSRARCTCGRWPRSTACRCVLHTDHCAKKLLPWVDGVIAAGEEYFAKNGEPLFSSHMLDLSEEPLDENLEISRALPDRASPR